MKNITQIYFFFINIRFPKRVTKEIYLKKYNIIINKLNV